MLSVAHWTGEEQAATVQCGHFCCQMHHLQVEEGCMSVLLDYLRFLERQIRAGSFLNEVQVRCGLGIPLVDAHRVSCWV